MRLKTITAIALGAATLAACTTPVRTGPVEVTRFVEPTASARLAQGTIFIESAPGSEADSLEIGPYKAAIARELATLGYREASRDRADQLAQVRIERFHSENGQRRRGPVSVGVGGSTGSYGSGVGVGLGINLGGGGSRETLETRLGVMIRDKQSGATYWEGRAQFSVSPNSPFADSTANASAIADALFSDFPGNNGETVEVRVSE